MCCWLNDPYLIFNWNCFSPSFFFLFPSLLFHSLVSACLTPTSPPRSHSNRHLPLLSIMSIASDGNTSRVHGEYPQSACIHAYAHKKTYTLTCKSAWQRLKVRVAARLLCKMPLLLCYITTCHVKSIADVDAMTQFKRWPMCVWWVFVLKGDSTLQSINAACNWLFTYTDFIQYYRLPCNASCIVISLISHPSFFHAVTFTHNRPNREMQSISH